MCKFIGKSNEQILCKLSKSEILRLFSIVHAPMETMKMSNFTCQSKSFISIFFTCQVSACELQPFSCHDLANDIYSGTPPYGHLTKTAIHFLVKKPSLIWPPVNTANFFGPMVAVLMGFHCTHKLQKLCSATLNWFLKSLKKYHNCANPIIHCIIMLLQLLHKKQFKVHANVMLSFQGSFLLMS